MPPSPLPESSPQAGKPAAADRLETVADFTQATGRDFTGYLVSLGLLNLGSLFLLPLVTGYLGAGEIGLYSLVEVAQIQGITFSLLGLKFAYLYHYAHTPGDARPRLLGTTLLLTGGASMIAGLLLWAIFANPALMARFDARPLPHAWLLLPLLIFGAMQTVLLTELRANRQVWLSGFIAVSHLLLMLLLSIVLVAGYGAGIPGFLAAQSVASALSCGIAWSLINRRLVLLARPYRAGALLRYGIPMMTGLMLRYSLDTLCRFLLAALVSLEAAGQFMIVMRIVLLFEALLAIPFFTAWGGLVHHALQRPAAAVIIGRITALAMTAASLLVIVMLAIRPGLFRLLAHDAMPELAGLFALLLASRAIQLVKSPLTAGILVTGQTGWAVRNNVFALSVFTILAYPATELWAATGTALALLAANLAATLSLARAAFRHCRPAFELPAIALAVTAGAASAATVLYASDLPAAFWLLFLGIGLGLAIWHGRHLLVADRV